MSSTVTTRSPNARCPHRALSSVVLPAPAPPQTTVLRPASTAAEVADFKERVKANPANYIAQPTLCLSSCPTFVERGIAPRHIDLRPFVLSGREVNMVAGGLTRVALKAGSLVVNSSQGGGTKDTWILERT